MGTIDSWRTNVDSRLRSSGIAIDWSDRDSRDYCLVELGFRSALEVLREVPRGEALQARAREMLGAVPPGDALAVAAARRLIGRFYECDVERLSLLDPLTLVVDPFAADVQYDWMESLNMDSELGPWYKLLFNALHELMRSDLLSTWYVLFPWLEAIGVETADRLREWPAIQAQGLSLCASEGAPLVFRAGKPWPPTMLA
ncbi:MAG: hypothetical protein J0L92_15980 [Deltaproteobacteria bacterium]|nr:hypothetical protein [Deltaproteobacteria bacterium]